jgi:hypothetical protein
VAQRVGPGRTAGLVPVVVVGNGSEPPLGLDRGMRAQKMKLALKSHPSPNPPSARNNIPNVKKILKSERISKSIIKS